MGTVHLLNHYQHPTYTKGYACSDQKLENIAFWWLCPLDKSTSWWFCPLDKTTRLFNFGYIFQLCKIFSFSNIIHYLWCALCVRRCTIPSDLLHFRDTLGVPTYIGRPKMYSHQLGKQSETCGTYAKAVCGSAY